MLATKKKPRAKKFREGGLIDLPGVEVFAAGTRKGEDYSIADLDQMVDNFKKFSAGKKPLLRVPAVLGHEENQDLLERSDLPSAAWAERCYREGPVLKVDWKDLAPQVAKLIQAKRYRTVSAEIYDEPPDGIPGQGKMLRRVAFLGGEIPEVKTLADIPMPVFSEERGVRILKFRERRQAPQRHSVFVFSEVVPMSREEMLGKLGELGFDCATITDAVPDAAVAEILRCMSGDSSQDAPDPADQDSIDDAGTPKPPAENTDGPDEDREQIRKLAEHEKSLSEHYAKHGEKKLAEHHARMAQKFFGNSPSVLGGAEGCAKNADDMPTHAGGSDADLPIQYTDPIKPVIPRVDEPPARSMGGTPPPPPPAKPAIPGAPDGSKHPTSVTMKYSELSDLIDKKVNERVAGLTKRIVTLDAMSKARLAQEKKATVKAFCERMLQEGKILPAELENADDKNPQPTLLDALIAADATPVRKFGEKTMSQLDILIQTIERRPKMSVYSERFKDPAKTQADGKDKAKKFYEERKQSFALTGMSEKDFLDVYEKANDKQKDAMLAVAS